MRGVSYVGRTDARATNHAGESRLLRPHASQADAAWLRWTPRAFEGTRCFMLSGVRVGVDDVFCRAAFVCLRTDWRGKFSHSFRSLRCDAASSSCSASAHFVQLVGALARRFHGEVGRKLSTGEFHEMSIDDHRRIGIHRQCEGNFE